MYLSVHIHSAALCHHGLSQDLASQMPVPPSLPYSVICQARLAWLQVWRTLHGSLPQARYKVFQTPTLPASGLLYYHYPKPSVTLSLLGNWQPKVQHQPEYGNKCEAPRNAGQKPH